MMCDTLITEASWEAVCMEYWRTAARAECEKWLADWGQVDKSDPLYKRCQNAMGLIIADYGIRHKHETDSCIEAASKRNVATGRMFKLINMMHQ